MINKQENRGRLATALYTGAALLVALSGCATTMEPVSNRPGTTFGKIYVDTPEVYSRERLVNDRFQQDAWLREKLREIPEQGLQGSTGQSRRTNTSIALAAGVKPQTPPTAQAQAPAADQALNDTPIAQFRDAMAYREEVRNEILENQLDDRHDIAGNTLYRLKFDATVLPLHDTSAYAMVEVTISGTSAWNIDDDDTGQQTLSSVQDDEAVLREYGDKVLPDWGFADYVPGLDERALTLYSRAYYDWVRDVDPNKYSKEDMLYGPLQAYFDVDDGSEFEEDGDSEFEMDDSSGPFTIMAKEHCAGYGSEDDVEAAEAALNALGVPSEYLQAGIYIEEMRQGDYVEEITYLELCVLTGLANFIADLREHKTTVYTYTVTPKERVQRISGESLAAGAVGVSIGAEQGGLGAALAHSNAREARANAIMRQPQVVGYSPEAHSSAEATLGWLIGPRYRISGDPKDNVSFRHVPAQHTLTGIISVPSWWTELKLTTRTYWMDENGVEFTQQGQKMTPGMEVETGKVTTIALPGDLTSIVDIFDPKRREPRLDVSALTDGPSEFMACERASVIIRGSQLWRSVVVTLGGQKADSILVLPNMEGIVATFNSVEPSISGTEELSVWTSEGEAHVRTMSIMGNCENRPQT